MKHFKHLFLIAFAFAVSLAATDSKSSLNSENPPNFICSYLGQTPPGRVPEIFAPGIVSTPNFEHSSPAISPDGKEFYWSSEGGIWYSRELNGLWTAPQLAPFSLHQYDTDPAFSLDGKRIYFLADRDANGLLIDEKLLYYERGANGWSGPVYLGDEINGGHLHWQFSFSKDGTLYFESNRDGGLGDIYMATPKNGDEYNTPVRLGPPISSESYDHTPFISRDNNYLLFARGDTYNSELYISFRKSETQWSEPVFLENVNTGYHEACPVVSPEGKYLFFIRIIGSNADVFWVDAGFIKEMMPLDLQCMAVRIKPRKPQRGDKAKIILNVKNRSAFYSFDTDVQFFLSRKRKLNKKSVSLGSLAVESIAPGKNRKLVLPATIPQNMKRGGYYIVAVLDEAGKNKDPNSVNNTISSKKKIIIN